MRNKIVELRQEADIPSIRSQLRIKRLVFARALTIEQPDYLPAILFGQPKLIIDGFRDANGDEAALSDLLPPLTSSDMA